MKEQTKALAYRKVKPEKKVYCVPRLPHKIDAMYDNVCRGNLIAYYLDPDPVRGDPVYEKLEKIKHPYTLGFNDMPGYERVAWYYMQDMKSRQMKESTYKHLSRMPKWMLRLEFSVRHETDRILRRLMANEIWYQTNCSTKQWTDYTPD